MSTLAATVAKDVRSRWQGVYVRHQKACAAGPGGSRCTCRPGFMARVYDRRGGRQLRSPTFRSGSAAAAWRRDTLARLERGEAPDLRTELRVGKAAERFVDAARDGLVLTKHGTRYKTRAIGDLESSLNAHVIPALGSRRLSDVRRGDVQRLVDRLAQTLSGSRVRSVVNAIRSLYRWAQDRDFVGHNPAGLVRLPAMNATVRDRVASPTEFARLLRALESADAVLFALAGYATARRQEIRLLRWRDVDLDLAAVRLGADEAGAKSQAALRIVPTVRPLASMLRAEYLRQGRPGPGRLVCPPRSTSSSGLISCDSVIERARARWTTASLDAIGLHESRHTAASWLNAAGVNAKVASELMGHSTPERAAAAAAGAAGITLGRYTHTMPGDLERARDLLDAYLEAAMRTAARI